MIIPFLYIYIYIYIYIFEIVVEIYFQSVFTWKYIKILLFLFLKKLILISAYQNMKKIIWKKNQFFFKKQLDRKNKQNYRWIVFSILSIKIDVFFIWNKMCVVIELQVFDWKYDKSCFSKCYFDWKYIKIYFLKKYFRYQYIKMIKNINLIL